MSVYYDYLMKTSFIKLIGSIHNAINIGINCNEILVQYLDIEFENVDINQIKKYLLGTKAISINY